MSEGDEPLFPPHSLTIVSFFQLLCVADRQNGRFDLRWYLNWYENLI